jgi:hypothetical protein
MTDLLDRSKSVTRDDYIETAQPGVWAWSIYDPSAMQSPTPQLPMHGTRERDMVLGATLDLEDMWSAAVAKAVTKIAVRGYEISDSDDSGRRTEKAKSLVMNLDGPSEYRSGMAKTVQDFLLADNGWFLEVERDSKAVGARPRALYHLDSYRCYRTGNLDYPVIYLDYLGVWHKLRADQVLFGSDMPSPRARMWGKGRCAASRAFQTIVKLSAVETYFREKITGSRALALHFLTGLGKKQLQDAIEGDSGITVTTIELASVPDGFDVNEERKDAYLRYANALGIPVQDIQPLSGQGLGTGTQSIVLDEAAEGQGIAFFVKDFEDKINNLVMPKTTVFVIKQNDVRDQQAQAALQKSKADVIVTLLGTGQAPGVITQPMALQMAVDDGLVPREFLPEDVTPEGVLTDSGEQSKPAGAAPVAPYAGLAPQAPPPPPAPAGAPVVTKSVDDDAFDRLLASPESQRWLAQVADKARAEHKAGRTRPMPTTDDEWAEAVKWAEEATE